ncbi:3-dehydroquinate synthase [Suttonella sp. R2A3]|uniref:3-dehydroquinate synthase n=1 Tax=Suttonella sp. R2A3 TaxID=2908648 RepID=UPI001F1ED7A5|nr:3-dehydroquinate synthase [Suttonella sp. R2A3]UJF23847.1 3-dehydroquinate synthase [Suttonella sp. R2A3]
MSILTVNLPAGKSRSYPILIEAGLLARTEAIREHLPAQQICIVTNDTIAPLYSDTLKRALGDKTVIEVILKDGEAYKNLAAVSSIFDALITARFNRDALIVALGGGVVGDIAGYAAASYQRGIACVQIPTTVLSQVDSSVGGKTGVNHPQGKNMIGAFHQPQAVLIDINVLETLPAREFSAGLAEVIKYGLINDAPFFAWLENHLDKIMAKDADTLREMIAHCCQNKADVVAADERESGQRALLNLGHTFGHAIESLTGYKRYLHGEAVSIGMVMAALLSEQLGHIEVADTQRIIDLLDRANLPIVLDADLSPDAIYQAMLLDKKVAQGQLRLIIMQHFGQCVIAGASQAEILKAIAIASVNAA